MPTAASGGLPLGQVKCIGCGKTFDEGETVPLKEGNKCFPCYDKQIGEEGDRATAPEAVAPAPPPAPIVETAPPAEAAPAPIGDVEKIEPADPVRMFGDDPREDPGSLLPVERRPGVPARPIGTAIAPWYQPQSLEQALAVAKVLWKSGLLPEDVKSPEAAVLVMMAGSELGFKPMQAFRFLYITKGRPALTAQGMMALILTHPDCEYFEPIPEKCSGTQAAYRSKRRGRREQEVIFTEEDAKTAGLLSKPTYKSWGELMYHARAQSILARRYWPDVVGGYYAPEEVDAFTDGAAPGRFDELQQTIATAPDRQTLADAATAANAAMGSGTLTKEQYEALRAGFSKRSAELASKEGAA